MVTHVNKQIIDNQKRNLPILRRQVLCAEPFFYQLHYHIDVCLEDNREETTIMLIRYAHV